MLQDLQRIVAEVVFMVTPSSAEVTQGRLVIEQVPEMRDALLSRGDWKQIGQTQLATVFADTAGNLGRNKQKMHNLMQAFDFMGMMEGVRARSLTWIMSTPHAHGSRMNGARLLCVGKPSIINGQPSSVWRDTIVRCLR